MPEVVYAEEPALPLAEFRRVLASSGLGASRPLDDEVRMAAMLSGADLILTARLQQPGSPLVGVARCMTDFVWCCYLSELAVTSDAQGLGVGRGLMDAARRRLGPEVSIILVSVPAAAGFYERSGLARIAHAFWSRRER